MTGKTNRGQEERDRTLRRAHYADGGTSRCARSHVYLGRNRDCITAPAGAYTSLGRESDDSAKRAQSP
jgi:hypothetical protein